jgi:hypothetical protein
VNESLKETDVGRQVGELVIIDVQARQVIHLKNNRTEISTHTYTLHTDL